MRKVNLLLLLGVFCLSAFIIPNRKNRASRAAQEVFTGIVGKKIELSRILVKNFPTEADVSELKAKIEALKQSGLPDKEVWTQADILFKMPPGSRLEDYDRDFRAGWSLLQREYGKALTPLFIEQKTTEAYNVLSRGEQSPDCVDKVSYVTCSAHVTAVAIIAHSACVGTLFGAPFCMLIVAAGQVAGIHDCYKTYCR